MSQTVQSPKNSAPITGPRFFVYCGQEHGNFTLKEEGNAKVRGFSSMVDAIKHARGITSNEGARLTVINPYGRVTMEWFL